MLEENQLMSQHSKKEEGKRRSEFFSKRLDYYDSKGHTNLESIILAHRDLAKEFKQKNPTLETPKPI